MEIQPNLGMPGQLLQEGPVGLLVGLLQNPGKIPDGLVAVEVLSLAVERGSVIEVMAEGPDAPELVAALEQLLARSEVPTLVTIARHKPTHG